MLNRSLQKLLLMYTFLIIIKKDSFVNMTPTAPVSRTILCMNNIINMRVSTCAITSDI